MAEVFYVSPYNKITGKDSELIAGRTLYDICENIQCKYPEFDSLIVNGKLTRALVVLVDRRGALTLEGLDTPIEDTTEIMFMKYLGWA
ncbi:MAG: hypothetical protein AB2L21_08075 [Anaerolineaceae bacterium]